MRHFGDIVVELGFITQEQLEQALDLQRMGSTRIGRIMVNLGMIDGENLREILSYQADSVDDLKFGVCAVLMGKVTEDQRMEAVQRQRVTQGVLGEILVSMGFMTDDQKKIVLENVMDDKKNEPN